jgi:hypothetical protein
VFTPFIGFGEGAHLFRWSLWMLLGFVVVYAIAAPFGASGMSIGYLASSILIVSTGLYQVAKTFGLKSQILNRDNLWLVVVCTFVYAVGLVTRLSLDALQALQGTSDLLRIVVIVSIPSVTHLVLLLLVSRSLVRDVGRILELWLGSSFRRPAGGAV